MMDWTGVGLLVLLIPLLMCTVMMLGGIALVAFGFRRADKTTGERNWTDRPSEPTTGES